MRAALRKLDRGVYRAERALAGALFLLLALVMAASVLHRIFSRPEGRLAAAAYKIATSLGFSPSEATIYGPVDAGLTVGLTLLVTYGAFRTMKRRAREGFSRPHALGLAAAVTVAGAGLVELVLRIFPHGLEWGPTISLGLVLWVGLLGASMATFEGKHLALEMGEKLWPARFVPYVRALGYLAGSGVALFLFALAVVSVLDHHASWSVNHLVGVLGATTIPKWLAFLVMPYAFAVMTLRFLGLAVGAARGAPAAPDEVTLALAAVGTPADGETAPSGDDGHGASSPARRDAGGAA